MVKIKFKVNPNAAKELAKQIEKNLSKKTGKKVVMDAKEVRKIQQSIDRLGK